MGVMQLCIYFAAVFIFCQSTFTVTGVLHFFCFEHTERRRKRTEIIIMKYHNYNHNVIIITVVFYQVQLRKSDCENATE